MRHVLLVNDDGVHAPGLRALADAFLTAGWRVSVVAPDSERSAQSHSITVKRPMVVMPTKWQGVPEGAPLSVRRVDGTPADCVMLGILEFYRDDPPDLVASGVNAGWNVGTDVHYSGTVGAAMEAAFRGVPALAVSTQARDDAHYAYAAKFAVRVSERLLRHPLPKLSALNLNIPPCPVEEIRGTVEAPLDHLRYTDGYAHVADDRGHEAYWLLGQVIQEGRAPGSDHDRLLAGYATITALDWDLSKPGACSRYLQDE